MDLKTYFTQESSLSRIKGVVDTYTCGAITSFRGNRTRNENLKNNNEILAVLKAKKFSVTTVKGAYIENFESEDTQEVGERSFFVVNRKKEGHDGGELEKVLRSLGEKYDQDSIMIVYDGEAFLVGTSKRDNAHPFYGTRKRVGIGKYGKVSGEFFSRVRGRQFAFEEVKDPDSVMGKYGMHIVAKEIITELNL
jgi:phosphoribosyl-AMP cyclohydrolase